MRQIDRRQNAGRQHKQRSGAAESQAFQCAAARSSIGWSGMSASRLVSRSMTGGPAGLFPELRLLLLDQPHQIEQFVQSRYRTRRNSPGRRRASRQCDSPCGSRHPAISAVAAAQANTLMTCSAMPIDHHGRAVAIDIIGPAAHQPVTLRARNRRRAAKHRCGPRTRA